MKKYGILFGLIISITSTSMAQINPNPRGTDMECVYLLLLKDLKTKREQLSMHRNLLRNIFAQIVLANGTILSSEITYIGKKS